MTTKAKGTHRTPEEKAFLIEKIERLRSEGKSQLDACKEAGVATGSYTAWKTGKVYRKSGKKAVTAVDLNKVHHTPTKTLEEDLTVVVFRGKPSAVGTALSKLVF